jgi:hypothetical protein
VKLLSKSGEAAIKKWHHCYQKVDTVISKSGHDIIKKVLTVLSNSRYGTIKKW